jgi:hypothetical protein
MLTHGTQVNTDYLPGWIIGHRTDAGESACKPLETLLTHSNLSALELLPRFCALDCRFALICNRPQALLVDACGFRRCFLASCVHAVLCLKSCACSACFRFGSCSCPSPCLGSFRLL